MSGHAKASGWFHRLRKSPHFIAAAMLVAVAVPVSFAGPANAAVGAGDITTFPAANITVDQGGADDVNSDQVDLTQMGNDPGFLPNPYRLFWSWDKTDWQGNNTGNACALLDHNGDGKVDQSVCAVVGNGGGKPGDSVIQVGTPVLYNCNNHFSDRCGTPSVVVGALVSGGVAGSGTPLNSTGNLITQTDPFHAGGVDSTIEVQIDQAHLTAKQLINVCTYPSAGNGGNNNPFDCIVNLGSSIGLTKTASSNNVNVGDPVTYTLTATNTGLSILNNVSITDTGFTPAPSLNCTPASPATLNPGDSMVCTFSHTFNAIPAGGSFTNTATTQGTDGTGATVTAQAHAVVNVAAAPTGTITVTKTVTGPAPAGLGNFDIDVTCGANTTHLHMPDGGSQNVTGIPNNTSCSVSEVGAQNADSTTYTKAVGANAPAAYTAGTSFTVAANTVYTVAVTNHYNGGTVHVTKTVTGAVPAGLGNFDIDVTCGGTTTHLHIAAGGSDNVTGVPGGTSCSATEVGAQGADATTYTLDAVNYTAGNSFTVSNNQTRTVAVTNNYNGGTIHVTKTVTGAAPAGLGNFDIDVTCGANVTHLHIAAGGSANVTGVPGGSSCSAAEVNAQGATTTTYTLDGAAYSAGTAFNVANSQTRNVAVTNDYVAAPPPPPPPPPAGAANLTLTKSSVPPSGSTVKPGDTITYTLSYANTGNALANTVVTSDVLPAGVTFTSAANGGTYDPGTNTVSWAIGNLAAGGQGTVSFVVTVAANVVQGQTISNIGSVAGAGLGPVASNPDVVTVDIPVTPPTPTLDMVKSVDNIAAEYGDTLTYTLVVTAGGADQTGVIATDKLPNGTSYVPASASCSTGCSAAESAGVVSWSIGDMAVGDSVTLSFRVTIDTPLPAADGGIPPETIPNFGTVGSDTVDPVDSNTVKTDVVAVLGITKNKPPTKKPEHSPLPFTGLPIPLLQTVVLGSVMILVGMYLTRPRRRRPQA